MLIKFSSKFISLILVIILGFILRLNNSSNYPFGFDQVQILENAQAIAKGDFRLIGPMTRPAQMFTGPLIYYISAVWILLIGSPYAIIATSISIYMFTSICLYWLIEKYLKTKYGLIYIGLFALSPYQVSLDRIPWNPNFTLLSALLIFIPLFRAIKTGIWGPIEGLLILVGTFLGYQAHFSGLILPILCIVAWIIFIRKKIIWLFIGLSGLFVSIIPTIIFDYRHDFLNARGLFTFLLNNHKSGESIYLHNLITNIAVTFENIGKMIFLFNSHTSILYIGLIVIGVYVWVRRKNKTARFILIWLLGCILALSIYKSGSPEYYFIIQFPAIYYMLSSVIASISYKCKQKYLLLTLFATYAVILSIQVYKGSGVLSLGNQIKTIQYLYAQNNNNGVSKIIFDTKPVNQIGMQYLLSNFPFNPKGEKFQINQPYEGESLADVSFGDIAVWVDRRNDTSAYLELPFVIVEHSKDIELLQNYYEQSQYGSSYLFNLFVDKVETGKLAIIHRIKDPSIHNKFTQQVENCKYLGDCRNISSVWLEMDNLDKKIFVSQSSNTILAFYPITYITGEQLSESLKLEVIKE